LSRFHRKIGSWLGLFAILMATLAPTISHSLATRGGSDTGMQGEHCTMPEMASMPPMDAMPPTAPMQAQVSDDADSKHTQHPSMSDGDACGYCSLLAHMPVVPGVETFFFIAGRALQHSAAIRFERVHRVEPLTFAQPRAPPFTS
jgi:hypothetical protein